MPPRKEKKPINKKTITAIIVIALMALPLTAITTKGATEIPQNPDSFTDTELGVTITSNSSIQDFTFNQDLQQISFTVSGTGSSIANVDLNPLPMADLIGGPLTAMVEAQRRMAKETAIFIDNIPVSLGAGYSQSYNGTNLLFQIPFNFTETDTVHTIKIAAVEDPPTDSTLLIFIAAATVIVLLSTMLWIKRKRFSNNKNKVIHALSALDGK